MRGGLFLSTEEYRPDEFIGRARRAADAGLSISDHPPAPWPDAGLRRDLLPEAIEARPGVYHRPDSEREVIPALTGNH